MKRSLHEVFTSKLMWGLVSLCLFAFPGLTFAQSDVFAAKNAKGQQMEQKKGNFTSFTQTHENISGWARFNKNAAHPEFGKLPFNADFPGYVEVIDKRQVDERYFVNEKNPTEFHIQKGFGALHMKKDGQWVTIDHRLVEQGNGIYEASQQYDPVGFDVKSGISYIKTPQGTVSFNNWKLYGADENGKEELLAAANWSNYTAGEDGIYVNEIFPGIDAQMRVYRGSVKTDFIVKKLLFANYTSLLFKDQFKAPDFSTLKFDGAGAGSKRASAVVLGTAATSLLEIGEAIAYPQNGTKEQRLLPEYILDGNVLTTSVAVSWIKQYINTTNVIIDPLVSSSNSLAQGSILGSMYNNNTGCTFAGASCNYNLSVNTPANATLTDVQWSFVYIAQGLCYLEDGAVRFATGACLSPSQSGFYWFCNAANPGTCTGTNVSIWSDLGSCMPAPSCSPQSVTFTMQFFRDCWGATGCSNACIGANSPWTMTIVGHTVEYTNTGTPFSVSANTICFGQSVLASTASQYGVPAHTFNWSFNSSGTPSVATGSVATINFPAPGTYTLYSIVTDACGQTQTANQVITVNPIPTVTATPSVNPICQGQSAVLTASGATTYTWSANAGGASSTTATVTPAVGTTVYTVTGTSLGCSNTGTVSVTVNPTPAITAGSSPVTICAGQTATLTANGANTYTWSSGGTASTETVAPGATSTYTVTGTSSLGCNGTQTVSVNVTPIPSLTVNPSAATVCAGAIWSCTVTGATTYTWSANAGGGTGATVSTNPNANDTYTVTGDNGGCIATQTVSVNVTPLPTLTITAAPASICTGQSTTLTVSGATTYTWSGNAGGGNGTSVVVSPSSNTTYTASGTQSGCSDSTVISVNVGAQPVVSVSATDTTLCSGQSTTLSGSGATNYTWSPGGPGSSISQSPNTTTTYTLIGDNGGCADTTTFVVNVTPTPTLIAVASPPFICAGQSSTLTVGGATTYTWSANAGGGSFPVTTVTPGSNTTYTVTGDSLGCTSTLTLSVIVTPNPTVTISAPTATVCSGSTILLTASGATAYTWSSNAGGGSLVTTTVTPVNNPETYTVTGANGICTATGTISIGVTATPTLTANASVGTLCAGQSSTLTVSGANTYTWSANANSSTSNTVVVTPSSSSIYTVTGENAGCTTTQTLAVNVNQLPTLSSVSSQTTCSGSTVNAINFNASVGATVNWTNTNSANGIATSGSGNIAAYNAPVVATQQTGIITATPTDAVTGCVGASQTFTVVINPKPTATAGVTDSALCGKPTGNVTGIVAGGGTPGYTYQWTTGGVNVPGATNANLSNVPMGTYNLTITDAAGCTVVSGPYTVPGTPAVIASFTATPVTGTAPLNVSTTNNSVGATSYNWNFGNGTGSTGTNANTTYNTGGTYQIILTASNGGCIDHDTITVVVDQSISIIVPNVFSPNGDGVNDDFFINCSGITKLSCEIFNRWGQKVKTLSAPTDKWDGKLDNGNAASEGTYFYVVYASSYDNKEHNAQGSITIVK